MRKIKAYKKPFTVDTKLYAYLRNHNRSGHHYPHTGSTRTAENRYDLPPCVYYQAIMHGEVSTPDGHMLSVGMRLKTELDNPDVDVIAEIGVCTNKPTEDAGSIVYTDLFFYNGDFYCKAADVPCFAGKLSNWRVSDYYNKKQYMLYKVDIANEEQFMQDFQEALAAFGS